MDLESESLRGTGTDNVINPCDSGHGQYGERPAGIPHISSDVFAIAQESLRDANKAL